MFGKEKITRLKTKLRLQTERETFWRLEMLKLVDERNELKNELEDMTKNRDEITEAFEELSEMHDELLNDHGKLLLKKLNKDLIKEIEGIEGIRSNGGHVDYNYKEPKQPNRKVGDTVYFSTGNKNEIRKGKIESWNCDKSNYYIETKRGFEFVDENEILKLVK